MVVDDLAAVDVEPSEEGLVEQPTDYFVAGLVGAVWLGEQVECVMDDRAAVVELAGAAIDGVLDLVTW